MSDPNQHRRPDAGVSFAPNRRRWPRRILVGANVVVAATIISIAAAYGYASLQYRGIKKDPLTALSKAPPGKAFTMLIVGSDTRNLSDGKAFGGSSATPGQRSDTIILARVVPADRQITLMSIPRDLYVEVTGMGKTRINSAFSSGPNLLVETIQNDLGIPINHYVEVNFDSFRQVSDAIGGVNFWFPTPARDAFSALTVWRAGCVSLSGEQGLAFVRSRHYQYYVNGSWRDEAASDLARIQRQQAYIKRMVEKARGQFTNPLALNSIVSGITKNLTLDTEFSQGLILSLATTFRGIDSAAIPSATLPTVSMTTKDGSDVLALGPDAQSVITSFNQVGTPAAESSSPPAPGSSTSASTRPPAAPSPSSVTVEVVNGTGIAGQAALATSDLTGAGYRATTKTSGRAFGGSENQIRYAPDAAPSAQALAARLVGGAMLSADPSLSSTSYNLELITGTSYAGLAKAGAVPATTATTAAPSSSLPPPKGATTAPYLLPGTPPGQLPPASCTP